jgi:ribosome modulation factor
MAVSGSEETNPYQSPELKEAWARGYEAGEEGTRLPHVDEQVHGDPKKEVAWLKGYIAARLVEQEEGA